MTLEELKLLRLVQGTLVRNYVDTQKLDIQVVGTSVYLEGDFHVFEYHPGQKKNDPIERDLSTKRVLLHVEQQIRAIGQVTHLEMKFSNWERQGLQWAAKHESYGV